MPHTLFYIRVNNDIRHYIFCNKDLAPVKFYADIEALTEIQDSTTKTKLLCLVQGQLNKENKINTFPIKVDGGKIPNSNSKQDELVLNVTYAGLLAKQKISVQLDAHLITCVWTQLQSSTICRQGFKRYVRSLKQLKKDNLLDKITQTHLKNFVNYLIKLRQVVEISVVYPKQKIDFAWLV